jgi:hypothetical protein
MQQPIISVNTVMELPDFRADVATSDLVGVCAVDLGDAAAAKRHPQTAGIGTIERARRFDVRLRRRESGTNHCDSTSLIQVEVEGPHVQGSNRNIISSSS